MNAFQKDVLSAIADDYEEIETIVSDLRNWHPDEQIKKTDVAVALQQLVEQGRKRLRTVYEKWFCHSGEL